MNFRNIVRRAIVLGIVTVAMGAASGCGAVVLANRDGYKASVDQLRAEMLAATAAATSAGADHDRAGYETARNRILNACGDAERLESYGEAAVKSFYGQQSSATVLAQLERDAYEKNCKVDGLDRLHEESVALDDSAKVLQEACGCAETTGYIAYGSCHLTQAAWDDYWDDDGRAIHTPFWTGVAAFGSGGLAPLFIGAGLLTGIAINADDKEGFCEAVHASYTTQFKKVAELREECANPPPAYAGSGALDAETLDAYIRDALDDARSDGTGSSYDGSDVYAESWEALQECNALVAALGPAPDGPALVGDIDTKVDQEPGELSYEIPEYTPPTEPTPPPGGG